MRRWFSFFLLVLLPLQFTWAAAAGYCQHETGRGVAHFGHHGHQHTEASALEAGQKSTPADKPDQADKLDSAGKLGKSGKATKLAADNDCGVCHLGGSSVAGEATASTASVGTNVLPSLGTGAFSTRAPDHPERPNWRIA